MTRTSPIVCAPVFVTFPVTVYVPLLLELVLVAVRSWYWLGSELYTYPTYAITFVTFATHVRSPVRLFSGIKSR